MQMRLEGVLKQKQQLMLQRQQLDVAAKQIEIQIQAKLREASMLAVTARQHNNAMGLAAAAAKQQQAQIEWGNATRDYAAKNLALQTEYSKLEAQEYQLNLQMSTQGGAAAPGAAPNSWQQAPSLDALRAAVQPSPEAPAGGRAAAAAPPPPATAAAGASAGASIPLGWWRSVTISSTARADASICSPGRDTVHCWSSVRRSIELAGATTSLQM